MSGEGVFQHYAVPEPLVPYVRRLWSYASDHSPGVERIVPDGCPELVIDLAGHAVELHPDGRRYVQPTMLMAGQLTKPMLFSVTAPIHVVGVSFQPDGARDFWGAPLHSLTDQRLDASSRLPAAFSTIKDEDALVSRLIGWLVEQSAHWTLDAEVRDRIELMQAGQHNSPLSRTLQRLFLDRVGVSARTLRSIQRFRSVFDYAQADQNWLQAGLDAGYFDQPQLARDFQRFVGCTASQWAHEQLALSRAVLS